jgi:hypothetical protein
MTTATKQADELKVGDVFRICSTTWWRRLTEPPRYDEATMSFWLTVFVIIPNALIAGNGDKNEFIGDLPAVIKTLSRYPIEVMNRE